MSADVLNMWPYVTSLLALLAAPVGVVFLVRGLRGECVGNDPHCRRCGRSLSDLHGNHCPKCGVLLLPDAVVVGARHRRRPSLGMASLLLALSLVWLALVGWLSRGR